jgi:hypothetical protein
MIAAQPHLSACVCQVTVEGLRTLRRALEHSADYAGRRPDTGSPAFIDLHVPSGDPVRIISQRYVRVPADSPRLAGDGGVLFRVLDRISVVFFVVLERFSG